MQGFLFWFRTGNLQRAVYEVLTHLRIKVVSLLNAFHKQLRINSIVNRLQLKLYRHWNYSALFSSLIRTPPELALRTHRRLLQNVLIAAGQHVSTLLSLAH